MTGDTKKTHHFNIVDFFLLLVLVLCIVGIVLRINAKADLTGETVQTTITIRLVAPQDAETASLLKKDTFLYFADGTLFGICSAVTTSAAEVSLPAADGTLQTVVHPNHVMVTCEVSCLAQARENGIFLNQTALSAGKKLLLHSDLQSFEAVVLSVTELS